jgi:cysteine desulfurase/selenocysteine lyase
VTTATSETAAAATDPLDAAALKQDFPILAEQVNGHPLAYLDSGATSQRPRAVLDAERDFLTHANAAVHRRAHAGRGGHGPVRRRPRNGGGLRRAAPEQLVWTSGATMGLNLAAYSLGAALRLGPGDEIVTTAIEHHANLIPWQELAARTGDGAVHPCARRRHPRPGCRRRAHRRAHPHRRVHARLERARHRQPRRRAHRTRAGVGRAR